MKLHGHEIDRDRVISAIAVAIIHVALGFALLRGLAVPIPRVVEETLNVFTVAPPPPPPEPERKPPPQPKPRQAPKDSPAPPNLKSKATEVVAPKPIIVIPVPPTVVVTEKPATGADSTSGAAPFAGPGTGAGGVGDGFGGGGDGGSPLEQIGGRITDRDYPREPFRAHIGGTVWVRYVVGVNGRVAQCDIQRSSGNADLDRTTCRLIVERFRFSPKRDVRGRRVPGVVVEDHTWVIDDSEPTDEEE